MQGDTAQQEKMEGITFHCNRGDENSTGCGYVWEKKVR